MSPELFNTSNLGIFPGTEVDATLKSKFDTIFLNNIKPQALETILIQYLKDSSYNTKDLNFLKSCSAEQYYEIFKNNCGDILKKLIKASLELVPILAKEALAKIASESKLNKLRISKFL